MERNLHNRKRILSEVVSLEAWQQPTEINSQLSLHADVVFKEGRIGGEESSKLRFKLQVKRAELIIVVPENEPVSVVRSSVSRDTIKVVGVKNSKSKSSRSSVLKSSVKAGLSNLKVNGFAGIDFSVAADANNEETIEHQQSLSSITVEQSLTHDGQYKWELSHAIGSALRGRPWDCVSNPRLTLIDKRKDPSKGIPPIVNIKIRCLREDLLISEIAVKDEAKWKKIVSGAGFKNKHLAAEAYIRNMLAKEGLDSGDISDPFCSINLAYITVDRAGI